MLNNKGTHTYTTKSGKTYLFQEYGYDCLNDLNELQAIDSGVYVLLYIADPMETYAKVRECVGYIRFANSLREEAEEHGKNGIGTIRICPTANTAESRDIVNDLASTYLFMRVLR